MTGGGGDHPSTLGGGSLLDGENSCQQKQDYEERCEVGSNLAPWAATGEHQVLANIHQAVLDRAETAGTVNLEADFINPIYHGIDSFCATAISGWGGG